MGSHHYGTEGSTYGDWDIHTHAQTRLHRLFTLMLALRSRLFLRVQPSRSFHPSFTRWNQSQTHPCPVCSAPLSSPLPACTKCWNLFALPQDLTHHALFGLSYDPNPFVIDLPQLKRKFIQAQAVCHPDAWASKNPVRPYIDCFGSVFLISKLQGEAAGCAGLVCAC